MKSRLENVYLKVKITLYSLIKGEKHRTIYLDKIPKSLYFKGFSKTIQTHKNCLIQFFLFFIEEKEEIEQIKDELWENPYVACWAGNDGYIQLRDDTSTWAPDISTKTKDCVIQGNLIKLLNKGRL